MGQDVAEVGGATTTAAAAPASAGPSVAGASPVGFRQFVEGKLGRSLQVPDEELYSYAMQAMAAIDTIQHGPEYADVRSLINAKLGGQQQSPAVQQSSAGVSVAPGGRPEKPAEWEFAAVAQGGPNVPPQVTSRVNAWNEYQKARQTQMLHDPASLLLPEIEPVLLAKARETLMPEFQKELQAARQQAIMEAFLIANSHWIYAPDGKGFSEKGLALKQKLEELEKGGMAPLEAARVAMVAIQNQQPQQAQQAGASGQPAVQPQGTNGTSHQQNRLDFLRNAAQQAPPPVVNPQNLEANAKKVMSDREFFANALKINQNDMGVQFTQ